MTFDEKARDFGDWWRGELSALIKETRNWQFGHRGNNEKRNPSTATRDSQVAEFPANPRHVVVDCPHLKLRLATRRLPLSRATEVARAAVQERTPFSLEEVYVFPGDFDGDQSYFHVVKKSSLDPHLRELTSRRTRVDRLGLRDGEAVYWLPPRFLERLHPGFSHIRHWRNALIVACVTILALACATYAQAYLRYSTAEEEINQQVEARRGEALQVRKLLDQQQKSIAAVEAARKGKSQSVPVVRVWEELTRILPDEVWLTDVSINDNTINIVGFTTQSAADLITTIDGSPLFSEPTFTSSVVRIPGQPGERFEIRLKVTSA